MQSDRDVICDRAMGSVFVVVPSPNLQFYLHVRKAHEPVCAHAFRPELAVERLDEAVVCRLARA